MFNLDIFVNIPSNNPTLCVNLNLSCEEISWASSTCFNLCNNNNNYSLFLLNYTFIL